MKITPGKLAGMKAVSNDRGVIAAAAMWAFALGPDPTIFPSYRESAIGLLRGIPASTVLHWWRGHPAGWWNPAEYRVASICVPIATQIPHAVGFAWGSALKGEDRVAPERPDAAVEVAGRGAEEDPPHPRERRVAQVPVLPGHRPLADAALEPVAHHEIVDHGLVVGARPFQPDAICGRPDFSESQPRGHG